MSKIFVVVGLVFLAGGAYAIGDGWPYLVLERGFTQVILGAISATLGILLLAIAVVFGAIQRLETTLEEHIAGAHPEPGFVPSTEPALHEPSAPTEPRPAFEPHVTAPVLSGVAAAAGAVAIGAGMAGLATAKSQDASPAEDSVTELDPTQDLLESSEIETAGADEVEERVVALDRRDWVDPLEADRSADPDPDPDPVDETAEDDSSDADLAEAEFTESAQASAIETPTPDEVVAADEVDAEPKFEAEPELVVPTPTLSVTPQPASEAPSVEPWWPRIQPRDQKEVAPPASDVRDEFGDLRTELSHALRTPLPEQVSEKTSASESENEPDVLATIRPWPPVTHPVAPETLVTAPEPESEPKIAEEAADFDADDRSDEWDTLTDAPPEPASTEPQEPKSEAPESSADEISHGDAEPAEPAASQEGIVGSYQVGEAHFTMYADGSIQARTPEGDYVFASMDELKAYLAREKSKLEPGAA